MMVIAAILALFLVGSALAQESKDFALPSPPEAVLKDTQNFRLGGADISALLYSSALLPAEINSYYQDFFARNQFKLIFNAEQKQKRVMSFQKDSLMVNISLERKGSGTEVGVASYLLPAGASSPAGLKPTFGELVALLPKQDQAGDDPAFIPRPPESVRLISMPVGDSAAYFTYRSILSVGQISKFYEDKMLEAGWKIENKTEMDEALTDYQRETKSEVGARPLFPDLTLGELISGGTVLHFKGEQGAAEIALLNLKSSKEQQGSFIQIKYVKK